MRHQLEEEKKAALLKIEEERFLNEKKYNEKFAKLEMEKFRITCTKELLDTEKKAIEKCKNQSDIDALNRPYKSSLLDEIQRINQPGDKNLHQTQMMVIFVGNILAVNQNTIYDLQVKEALQRCRDASVFHLDFKQTQVADEFGFFKSAVYIIDRDADLIAEWPTARLNTWLNIIRENGIQKNKLFDCVDIEWTPNYDFGLDNSVNDSLNSSRISVNLNAIKDALLGNTSPLNNKNKKEDMRKQITLKQNNITRDVNPQLLHSKKMLLYEDEPLYKQQGSGASLSPKRSFNSKVNMYIKDLCCATMKLKKICGENQNLENIPVSNEKLTQSLEKLEQITQDIKVMLLKNNQHASDNFYNSVKSTKSVRFAFD